MNGTRSEYEIAIVGGGPAGLTAALALLHMEPRLRGHVLLLERYRYPRDKFCAGAVGRRGLEWLERLDAVPDVPACSVTGMSVSAAGRHVRVDVGQEIGRVVRRVEFDHALARVAHDRGVVLRDDTRVLAVHERTREVQLVTRDRTYSARCVLGADGVASVARRALELPEPVLRAQVLEVDTPRVDSDGPWSLLHFDLSDRHACGYGWDFPTHLDDRELVCRGVYHLRLGGTPVDLDGWLARRLTARGIRPEDCRRKRYAERGYVTGQRLSSERIVLIGEAAGIDPVTGEGIAQAMEYGWLAASFVLERSCGASPLSMWSERLARSRLGVDLRVRSIVAPLAFGPLRSQLEQLVTTESFVRAGCQHFGALPVDASLAMRSLGKATVAAARWALAASPFARSWEALAGIHAAE